MKLKPAHFDLRYATQLVAVVTPDADKMIAHAVEAGWAKPGSKAKDVLSKPEVLSIYIHLFTTTTTAIFIVSISIDIDIDKCAYSYSRPAGQARLQGQGRAG